MNLSIYVSYSFKSYGIILSLLDEFSALETGLKFRQLEAILYYNSSVRSNAASGITWSIVSKLLNDIFSVNLN